MPGPYDNIAPDDGAALGVAWLRTQQANPKLVLVPTMANYQDNDLLRKSVPKSCVVTMRSRPRAAKASAVLGCWPIEDALGMLHEQAKSGGAVAILRWDNGWAERAWIDSLGAVNLITGVAGSGFPDVVLDPTVEAAMKSLARTINHSTWHQTDRSKVKWVLLNLPRYGHSYIPDELAVWAPCNDFRWREVLELHHLAKRVHEGHMFKIGHNPYRSDIIDQWRAEAAAIT